MTDHAIVTCQDCRRPYTARVRENGSLILPVADDRCPCGGESFVEFDL